MSENSIELGNKITSVEKSFQSKIDEELVHLYETGDFSRATKFVAALDTLDTVSGHAKAKMLYGFNDWWKENRPQDNFGDHIESTTATRGVTVKRYISVWKYIEQSVIPKEISIRPMRDLVPIANTLEQGYDIGKADWRKLNLAANDGELRDVIRKIKGKPAKKNAKVLKIDRKGNINLYVDDKKKFVGFLNFEEGMVDDDIQKAINKIIAGASMVEE